MSIFLYWQYERVNGTNQELTTIFFQKNQKTTCKKIYLSCFKKNVIWLKIPEVDTAYVDWEQWMCENSKNSEWNLKLNLNPKYLCIFDPEGLI